MLRMSLVLYCLISIYEWMISEQICVKNKYIHPIVLNSFCNSFV